MKKLLALLAACSLTLSASADQLDQWKKDTDSLYRTGGGAEDGTYTAIATSMLGWGLGLSVGIGILASVLHQSAAGHSATHCHCSKGTPQ
jgi:hypothetical protein